MRQSDLHGDMQSGYQPHPPAMERNKRTVLRWNRCLRETEPYAGTPSHSRLVLAAAGRGSQKPADMGAIRREGPICLSETLRDFTFGAELMELEAQWVTGFVDGEGCFYVGVNPHPDMTTGYQVLPEFTVVQHERDIELLHALKTHFGCGVVRRNHGDRMAYRVRSQRHLVERIIPFFERHPLKSKKRVDFEKFRRALQLMEAGEHLTPLGIQRIRDLAAQMNRAAKIKSGLIGNGEG